MKKLRILSLVLILVLLLGGCQRSRVCDVTVDGVTLTVDLNKLVICHGSEEYTYSSMGMGTSNSISGYVRFTYPNNATYEQHYTQNGSQETLQEVVLSDTYDPDRYVPGEILFQALRLAQKQLANVKPINIRELIIGIVLLIVGLLNALFPEGCWHIRHFLVLWMYQNPEPTEEALRYSRGGGIVITAIGLILILAGLF